MKRAANILTQERLETGQNPVLEKMEERPRPAVTNPIGFSTRLLALNGLAIIGVILHHSVGWAFWVISWKPHGLDQIGKLTYYSLRTIDQAIAYAIPTFVFISGYFIAFAIGRIEASKQWKIIFTRIKNLVIPFLIWSVLILILDTLLGNPYIMGGFLLTLITAHARELYYFVYLLIQFFILSPFLVSLARSNYKLLLAITAVVELAVVGLRYVAFLNLDIPALQPFFFIRRAIFFPGHLFFFSFGIVFSLYSSLFKQKFIQIRWGMLISLVVLFIVGIIEWEMLQSYAGVIEVFPEDTLIDNLYALAFIVCFLAFEEFSPLFFKQLALVGGMSFGIYLTHWSVQEYISKAIYHFSPWLMDYQIIMQPILIVFGLGLPIVLMTLVKRSPIKQYYRYLFG